MPSSSGILTLLRAKICYKYDSYSRQKLAQFWPGFDANNGINSIKLPHEIDQKFHNSWANYFAQSCGKNRLKAANLHPEKPFAHWRHFMASKCAKWLIFRCVNQSLSAHLAKLAKFAQKNLQRKRKRKFPRGYAARGKSRVTSAIRYGRLETVKGHKGWWRRLPIFATLQSSVAVGIADTTSGAMRPHLVAVAPRPLLRHYVPCPLTVHRTVLGCPKPRHYRSALTSQHHAENPRNVAPLTSRYATIPLRHRRACSSRENR